MAAATAACDKKGSKISLLNLGRSQAGLSDYLLLMNANSHVHMKTLRDSVLESLEGLGLTPLHFDGRNSSSWTALDYGGLMVHIFLDDARDFYALERLWPEAKKIPFKRGHSR